MSGLVNKIKEAVHSDKKDNAATDNPHSTNAGPHGSNFANTADPRVDSDRDNIRTGPTGTTGTTGATGAGYGSSTTGAGYGSSNTGPHSSNAANKVDPRVTSDRDGRGIGHSTAGNAGGIGSTGTHGTHGTHGTSGIGSTVGYGSSKAGPYSSNIANSADPRVDSDRDGRGIGHGTAGNSAGIGSTGTHGAHGTSGIGSTGTHGTSGIGNTGFQGTHGSTNPGPYSSNLGNKADPRIDSDLDGGRSTGFGTSGTGHGDRSGYTQGGATPGSGLTGSTPGSGNASKTAGPHNSDLLNKLDPRVDSNLDGSKTVGGNATRQ